MGDSKRSSGCDPAPATLVSDPDRDLGMRYQGTQVPILSIIHLVQLVFTCNQDTRTILFLTQNVVLYICTHTHTQHNTYCIVLCNITVPHPLIHSFTFGIFSYP